MLQGRKIGEEEIDFFRESDETVFLELERGDESRISSSGKILLNSAGRANFP